MTAVIAEDEALIAEDLVHELERNGIEVVARARTADATIAAVREHRPRIVILDIDLAGGSSGLDAARTILDEFGQRCVFLSGRLDAETRQRINALDPIAVLSKPLLLSQLLPILTTDSRTG